MGLGIAESAAISGIKVNKQAFDVLAQNISNANNPNYNLKQIEFATDILDGQGVGVKVASIARNLDQFLQTAVINNTSSDGNVSIINDYNERIQILFGNPGEVGTLSSAMSNFFASLKLLSTNPDLRQQAVQNAAALAQKVYDVSNGLQQLRYDADQDLFNSLQIVNSDLASLDDIQNTLVQVTGANSDNTSLLDLRDAVLSDIAKYIDISYYTDASQNVNISTSNGNAIYSGGAYYFSYNPAAGPDVFVNDLGVNDVVLYTSSTHLTNGAVVIKGGTDGNVVNKIQNGKVTGLQQIRDVQIPRILEQLDNLTAMLRDNFNKVHNDGCGFPPANQLVGTTVVNPNDNHQFLGKVRIAALDTTGKPLPRSDGTALNPLLLNLNALDSGLGAGSPSMQTIINEINQYFYFDPLLTKMEMGNLEDIRIASETTNMVANGTFKFDFELVNNSTMSSNFQVTAISVYDNTATLVAGSVTTTLPVILTTNPGDRIRTPQIVANFSTGSGPYTIRATIQNTDDNNVVTNSVVNFVVSDTPANPNIMNNRYVATSIMSGNAKLVPPSSIQQYVYADIVNSKGTVLTNSSGFLRLSAKHPNYGLAISELDSQELGFTYSSGLTIPATNRGFSHFLGLNNLFVDTGVKKASSSSLQIRPDIELNPNLLSTAQLAPSASYITQEVIGTAAAVGNIQFNANPALNSTITLNGVTFTYVAVSAANNQITLGGSLATTLTNTLSVLNANNATTNGKVDQAVYTSNGTDTLTMTSIALGSVGNNFSFSFNLLGGAAASIDGGLYTVSNAGNLVGGSDSTVNVIEYPNSFEVSVGASQAVSNMYSLSTKPFKFTAAGTLPIVTTTLNGYAGTLVSYAASVAQNAQDNLDKQTILSSGFYDKFREGSGVVIDQEIANTVIYQNAYIASATVYRTTQKLFDVLLESFK